MKICIPYEAIVRWGIRLNYVATLGVIPNQPAAMKGLSIKWIGLGSC